MAAEDIEHETEIHRTRSGVPALLAVAVLALLVGIALGLSADDAPEEAPTPTTSTTSTPPQTPPARLAVVHLIAHTEDGPRPATTADAPGTVGGGDTFEAIQATPVVTDGRVVALVDGGTVVAGRPGGTFRAVGPETPTSMLVASNEPGHVWAVTPEDDMRLVDLDGLETLVRIPLGGDRVLGPASFGVVTRSPDGVVSWRRPSFDPTPIGIPSDRVALDAGGDVILVEVPDGPGDVRRLEAWSVVTGRLVRGYAVSGDQRAAVLATDGSTVAVPQAVGWIVRDTATGEQRGTLPASFSDPVWIGGGRFAVQVDGGAAVSDGSALAPRWRIWALAEQSP
jgi:hypothetical protein